MYHFVSEQTAELRLSDNVLISSNTTQYLKYFQLEAVRFLYERLSKQEFCILNDENGLGKTASVVALLSGLGPAKKTLIVLQNDDQMLAGWQFHFGVLSDLPVCVIKDVNDSTESAHSVYLSKWGVLRSIGDLSKLKFDYIVIDHRGYTLNNSFCTSMLLKQYERKVNIVISSVDITSDVKLLYNVLRLGGCLENHHKTFRSFERKYHLPDVKEVLSKRVDLEEYYKQRGVLGEYIKDYRLRRYRHQFESYLPLVSAEQYKRNLNIWLSENNSNSTISQTTLESSSEARSTGGTDEIFECLMNIKRERESAQREDPEKVSISDHSEEVVAMEPLIFEMSDSESDVIIGKTVAAAKHPSSISDVMMLSSDDCEIVTPPKTPPHLQSVATTSPITKSKRKYTKRCQVPKPTDLTESESEQATPLRKITRKKLNVRLNRLTLPEKTSGETTAAKSPKESKENKSAAEKPKNTTEQTTPQPSKAEKPQTDNQSKPSSAPKMAKRGRPSSVSPKTENQAKCKKYNTCDLPIQTRGMQRLTRSADSRRPLLALEFDKKNTPKKKRSSDSNQTPKTSRVKKESPVKAEDATTSANAESKVTEEAPKKKRGRPRKVNPIKNLSNEITEPTTSRKTNEELNTAVATQELLSSGSILSDYSYMQCAQKLPENLADMGSLELPQFRMPHAPQATPLMLPSTLNIFSDSEVAVVPNSNHNMDMVVINSSHDDSSQQSEQQSRRTRALKKNRSNPPNETPSKPTTSNFGLLLAQQRGGANKSPDIFSNCSDMSQITLAQPALPSSPFEGFKIFGSEVKQIQQQHAKVQQSTVLKKNRNRSCLDLLENMFDPQKTKTNGTGANVMPELPNLKQQMPARSFTLLDDDIFEITNNGEFGSRLRLNSAGNVSPVQQQQLNKITNYLISSGGTPEDAVPTRTPTSQATRKSPKSIKCTQSTKLTRWFGTLASSGGPPESQSVPSTPVMPADKIADARSTRSGGGVKRKRLNLFK